jgi:hypothetical protein
MFFFIPLYLLVRKFSVCNSARSVSLLAISASLLLFIGLLTLDLIGSGKSTVTIDGATYFIDGIPTPW